MISRPWCKFEMLSDKWLPRYGLLENSVMGKGMGMHTTVVTTIALCNSCSQAKKDWDKNDHGRN